MSEKLHVGAAWEEPTAKDPSKRYYRVAVDLGGLVPSIFCRVVECAKQKSERSPSHVMLFSPVDGEDRAVGAFWPQKASTTDGTYLMGQVTLSRLGVVELKGGAKLDMRLAGGAVSVKLVAAKQDGEPGNPNRPTHYLLRTVPRAKMVPAETAEAEDDEEVVEKEEVA